MFAAVMRIGIGSLVLLSIGCLPRETREIANRAQSGDPQAMYEWGKYRKRQGLHSYEAWDEAIRWYERAAERGNTSAMVTMGRLLLLSSEPDDCRLGFCWFARAARAGDMEAQLQMHRIYQFGEYAREGFPKDPVKAAYWMSRVKESGEKQRMENERQKTGAPAPAGRS